MKVEYKEERQKPESGYILLPPRQLAFSGQGLSQTGLDVLKLYWVAGHLSHTSSVCPRISPTAQSLTCTVTLALLSS